MLRKSLTCLVLLLLPVVAPAEDLTVDDIIAKNIEAKGGRDALDAVKAMRKTGTVTMDGGQEAPLTVELKRPKKIRVEFTLHGMTAIQAFDGNEGWTVMPFVGQTEPQKMSSELQDQFASQADFGGVLVDFASKGHTVELIGKEDVDGTPAYRLKVTRKGGKVEHHFIDAEYFLEFKIETKEVVQDTEMEMEVIFGDYKEVAGLMLHHSAEQRVKDTPVPMGQTTTFQKIEVNPTIDDDRFRMPAAPEQAGE